MGGTPQKTAQQVKAGKDLTRNKTSTKPKHLFEYNTLKSGITGQPNPNHEIVNSILSSAMKSRHARKKLNHNKKEAEN